jgi:hypothetical protein
MPGLLLFAIVRQQRVIICKPPAVGRMPSATILRMVFISYWGCSQQLWMKFSCDSGIKSWFSADTVETMVYLFGLNMTLPAQNVSLSKLF